MKRSSSYEQVDKRTYKQEMIRTEEVMNRSNRYPSKKSRIFNPTVFTLFCCLGNIGFTGFSSYLSGALGMVEKRFQLRSSQSGLFFTTSDMVGLCTVLFITYFGQKGNRPRVIALLYVCYGVGALLCSVPHFLYDLPPSLTNGQAILNDTSSREDTAEVAVICDADVNQKNATCNKDDSDTSGALWDQAWWLFLGHALAGLGSSIGPLMITFLDDNQSKKNTPIYVGIAFSSFTLGIVVGFFLANVCLGLPVNFPSKPTSTTITDPKDPRFLGAWWLGLIVCGVFIILSGLPLFFFPRRLPGNEKYHNDRNTSIHGDVVARQHKPGFVKEILQAFKRIVTNTVVLLMVVSTCTGFNIFVGLRIYSTKYLETQFDISTSLASLLTGIIVIPSAIFGNLIGGLIVKKLKLQVRGMAAMALTLSSCVLIVIPLFFISGCPQKPRVGLTVPYRSNNETLQSDFYPSNLDDQCNLDCYCPSSYRPVCGADGVTYISPCHAGCTYDNGYQLIDGVNSSVYSQCECISMYGGVGNPFAVSGECYQECSYYFHLVLSLFLSSLVSLLSNPLAMIKIRCVEERDRSLVLGFTNVMMKLLAYIPGPVMWGYLIDMSCILFQESCGKTGNCLVYNTDKFRNIFYGTMLSLKSLDVILITTTLIVILYSAKKEKTYNAMKPPKVVVPNTYDDDSQEQTYTAV
ncbi:Solute carrier organic anion transporter family member 2A1 [Holothuria leucospilota]|uniref:Solute carrier organic anion transporter family member n=1 Tax=Holothuria leucospilota TaxID=206669 RepID=A0A9Q1CH63_HOLLE|nr:Solute carrier organic anion transporter family member 2A1 [Holothuria leucospilota]